MDSSSLQPAGTTAGSLHFTEYFSPGPISSTSVQIQFWHTWTPYTMTTTKSNFHLFVKTMLNSLKTFQDFCGLAELWSKYQKVPDADQYIKIVYLQHRSG